MTKQSTSNRRSYWTMMIKEYEASGLSKAGFCRRKGIPTSAFYSWAKVIATDSRHQETQGTFVPLKETRSSIASSHEISLSLKLSSGAELKVSGPFDIEMLKDLMRGLL